MDLMKLIGSKDYNIAQNRIGSWKTKLEKGKKDVALKIRDEKSAFFSQIRRTNPELYAVFKIDEKTLDEIIYEKLTGQKITID